MELVDKSISIKKLEKMAKNRFGDMVKAVVDLEKEVMVIDAELHADQESYLLEKGSKQKNLWGINLYPNEKGEQFVEFNSMINLRPSDDNLSLDVESEKIRKKIRRLVDKLVEK